MGTTAARQADTALRDIQYRLVGLTRPLDWFIYQSIHANWTPDELLRQSQSVARDILDLLADVASHVSEMRIQGLLADVKLPTKHHDNLLISNEEIIHELVTAKRRLHDALQPPKPPSAPANRKGKGKRRQTQSSAANARQASGNQSSPPASDSTPVSTSDAPSVGFSQKNSQNHGRHKQQQRRN
ncbi:hypothetical protein BC940DRAFT_331295 [Gongronella butleri]|nr:hypothetical protein BC940DRAFT_331295 [Gongronella butleri]